MNYGQKIPVTSILNLPFHEPWPQFDQNLTWYVHSAERIPFNLFSIDYKRHFSVYFLKFSSVLKQFES